MVILEKYEVISPITKKQQIREVFSFFFINSVIFLAKGESLKIVLDARYLNSSIDESKSSLPIEPVQVIFPKTNGKYYTTAVINSA